MRRGRVDGARTGRWMERGRRRAIAAAALAALSAGPLRAQSIVEGAPASSPPIAAAGRPALPFGVGERLDYRVRVAGMGAIGRGAMWIEGPVDVRGSIAWLLRSDFRAGKGPIRALDRTSSWLDPLRMAALRFSKEERHPLSRHVERVELYPETRRWAAADGESGESPSGAPLDELSFIYFLRTIALDADTVMRFDRHFDAGRNPTTVRVVGRDRVRTEAGEFPTVVLEMRVRDPRRYRGEGVIRIDLSDDDARVPVRIESRMPGVGTAVMLLSARTPAGVALAGRDR